MHKIAISLLALLSFSVLTACAAHDDHAGATLARIHALIGTPSCSADSQCKTLALGARPCGGPEGYLVYSSARTSESELRALGDRYQAERRSANTRAGMMSDCRARLDPGAVCQAGACTLGIAAPAAAPVAR